MSGTRFLLLLAFLLCDASHALAADKLLPQYSHQIEVLQRQAEKLAANGLDPNNYHLAKARTWLDLAFTEYYYKDDSGVVSAAIGQAEALLDALEKKQTNITMDTPRQVMGSEVVRPDLWDQIAMLKKQGKFSCGQRPAAEAEVYLVWASYKKFKAGMSHAESYLRSAEDRVYEAQIAINNCAKPAASPPPLMEIITLSSDALFDFGEATLNPSAPSRLDELAKSIQLVNTLEEVVLVGHTDRLRSDGHPERNQLLSEQRAESIKQYLIGKGIAADRIHASGAGSTQPIVECPDKPGKARQIDCLVPNRRVEIILRGRNAVRDDRVFAK
jgi:outer membrane protein OmpA-like peptidoglycan-associated protein